MGNLKFLVFPVVSDWKIITVTPYRVCIYHFKCIGLSLLFFLLCFVTTLLPNTYPQYMAGGVVENTNLQKKSFSLSLGVSCFLT